MNIRLPNQRFLAITEIYAFVAIAPEGEGIMGFGTSLLPMPMVFASKDLIEKLRPIADEITKRTGVKYEIRRYVLAEGKIK